MAVVCTRPFQNLLLLQLAHLVSRPQIHILLRLITLTSFWVWDKKKCDILTPKKDGFMTQHLRIRGGSPVVDDRVFPLPI